MLTKQIDAGLPLVTEAGPRAAADADFEAAPDGAVEVSVVMPCLNEQQTIGRCVQRAAEALRREGLAGEVIVADNGSTDGSIEIAESMGARVVHEAERGYGAAYMKGIAAARGRYILIGDSDSSYDFDDLPRLIEPLRQGCDLVQFYEYFHGDNGAGLGASHQTGWTALVASLIDEWRGK